MLSRYGEKIFLEWSTVTDFTRNICFHKHEKYIDFGICYGMLENMDKKDAFKF